MALPKVGEKVSLNESSREDIMKEIDILCSLNHPNIIFLKEYFIENNKVFLITELLSGARSCQRCALRACNRVSAQQRCSVCESTMFSSTRTHMHVKNNKVFLITELLSGARRACVALAAAGWPVAVAAGGPAHGLQWRSVRDVLTASTHTFDSTVHRI